MRVLVTGAAGFIGFHLAKRFCEMGHEVVGIDNLNDYYDVSLKQARLGQLECYSACHPEPFACHSDRAKRVEESLARHPEALACHSDRAKRVEESLACHPERSEGSGFFTFKKMDISDREAMEKLFRDHEFDRVVHLAAQAGVRYSLENPHAYIQSNVVDFLNVLEGCRHQWCSGSRLPAGAGVSGHGSRHLVYASSSSVYGLNTKMPFSVHDNVDHPISLYAATKKADELMAHTYSHLYGMPTTGLRFFTVYGPWGRPDMALFKFTKAIINGDPIDVYNEGQMRRDFTYIDDVVEGVIRVTDRIPTPLLCKEGQGEVESGSSSTAPYKLYNIGNNNPVGLMDFIGILEGALGKKARTNMLPMQPGDVQATYADVDDLMRDIGFLPDTPIEDGIGKFVEWYKWFNKEQERR